MFSHSYLADTRFFEFLKTIDEDLAEEARALGCPCGGRLDSAPYPRKPRGAPQIISDAHDRRLSLCCAACRRRVTPPSVRFLGRRVYFGVVVVLAAAMLHGPTATRITKLKERFGANRKTLLRWRDYWQRLFPATAFWRGMKGRFTTIDDNALPSSLLAAFPGAAPRPIQSLLRFIAPLTTSSCHER